MKARLLIALAVLALGGLLLATLLTAPRTPDAALEAAVAAAAHAAGQAADARAALDAAAEAAGDDRAVRLLDGNGGVVAGEPVEGANSRSAAVAPVSPPPGSTVAFVEVSEPAAARRSLSAGRVAVIAACAGMLMLVALLTLAAIRRTGAVPVQHTPPPAPQPRDGAGERQADERGRLVRGLIAVVDNSDDEYVAARALDALDDAGVEAIRPAPGDPFDPGTQSIAGVIETDDERRDRDVIAVLRPGFKDHDTLVREAEVQIYVARTDGEGRS